MLDRAGVHYTVIDATEHKDLARKYRVMPAPPLVLVNGESFERLRGVSDIKGWLESK